ncbi:MAG: hypothetical protein Fur0021_39830 [Candidatus Promineifilaceae bacterium]
MRQIWQRWWLLVFLVWTGPLPDSPPAGDLQALIDAAYVGDTITLQPDQAYTGAVVYKPGLSLNLNGATIMSGPTGPGLIITAADVAIICSVGSRIDGDLDGYPGDPAVPSSFPGIQMQAGADNVIIEGCDIRNWLDGVQVTHSLTSLKLVHNYLHDNGDAGLQIDTGVSLAGIVSIMGNLFKANEGPGIRHDGAGLLPANHNSWGHIDGAIAGDGIGGSGMLDASAPTFVEAFVGVDPENLTTQQRTVSPGTSLITVVAVDAANLYGLRFSLTYDPNILTLQNLLSGDFVGRGTCLTTTEEAGRLDGVCYRQHPDVPVSDHEVTILQMEFLAHKPGVSIFDLQTTPAELAAGARGGVGIYVNNGGYGGVAGNLLRQITDENDGEIIVAGPTAVSLTQFGGGYNHSPAAICWLLAGMLLLLFRWNQTRRASLRR